MDLYSSDYAGIQEGNMRTKSVMDRNQAVQEHNNDVATQISNLKDQQRTGDLVQGGVSAVQQFWAGGKIPNQITALQDHLKAGGTLFSNPTSEAQAGAQKAVSDATSGAKGFFTKQEVTAPETPAIQTSDDARSALESGLEEGAEGVGSTALKALGGVTAVATGAMDIYKDFESGGIAGDNWASKTSNILQIGGAIADLGGTLFPPLAIVGGVADIAAGVFGEVGAVKDDEQQQQDDDTLQAKDTEQQEAVSAPQTFATGRVS